MKSKESMNSRTVYVLLTNPTQKLQSLFLTTERDLGNTSMRLRPTQPPQTKYMIRIPNHRRRRQRPQPLPVLGDPKFHKPLLPLKLICLLLPRLVNHPQQFLDMQIRRLRRPFIYLLQPFTHLGLVKNYFAKEANGLVGD